MDHGVTEASDRSPSKTARRGFLQRIRDIIGHLQALDLEALPGLIAKFEASQRRVEAATKFPHPATLEPISPLELKTLGRYQLENRCRALANPVYLGNQTALCRILGSYKLYVDTADTGFGSHVLLEGYWEMWLTMFFARHLQPGMTVIDVGANFGYYSVLFGALVEDTGHVYAIEPNPAVVTRLRRSIDLNGFASRTTIVEAAAGAVHGGEVTLYAPHGEPKNGTVVGSPEVISPELGTIHTVRKVSLDEVAAGASRIDFVKIDAEGAEEGIIAGMMNILTRDRPRLILEFNAARYRDPRGFLDQLQAFYTRMRFIDYQGAAVSITVSQITGDRSGEDWLLYFDQAPALVEPESLPKRLVSVIGPRRTGETPSAEMASNIE
jgi:FkbM family methyltransferase